MWEVAADPCWIKMLVFLRGSQSLDRLLPGVCNTWLWGLGELGTSKGLSLQCQPADSKFPVFALVGKDRVMTVSPSI